jgi:phosphoribosylanthranilate isomerase
MNVKIKICGITSTDDAKAVADCGADAIGLMFYKPSPRFVSMEMAARIAAVVPSGIMKVGVFVNPSGDLVNEALTACGLDMLQFHGDEAPGFCRGFGVRSMKAFRIRDAASLAALKAYDTDAWLLDAFVPGSLGGSGVTFNWDLAVEAVRLGRPVFLAGGLTPENVAGAVRSVRPYGVDVSSGVESAPGRKDPEKVRAFVAAVRAGE